MMYKEQYNKQVNMDPLRPHSWPLDLPCFDDSSGRPLHKHMTVRVSRINTRMGTYQVPLP